MMLKLIDIIKHGDNTIQANVLIEGKKNNSFLLVVDSAYKIIRSTATEKQRVYEAQARIAFKNHYKDGMENISSMWY